MGDMSSEISCRWAVPADAAAIVALAHSAYRGESSRVGWTTEADFLDGQRIDNDGVLAMIGEGQGVVLLESGGELLGCAHLRRDDGDCWFGLFAVQPGLQGQGLGDRLLTEAERRAGVEFGARRMRMMVIWLRDALIAWYERRGYARTDQTRPFPYGDARFGLPRRDDLHFVVLEKMLSSGR